MRAPRRPLALSPSRASDFKTCPLLYRFRAVDRLPEPPSAPAARGTLVHSVLEQMFGRPAAERTPNRTAAQVGPAWEQMSGEYPELLDLLPADDLAAWLESAQDLVRTYFTLEDPRRFDPEACEFAIEIESADAVPLRGLPRPARPGADRAIAGRRLQDRPLPRSGFRGRALYQLKFYALMIYRLRGVVPAQLKLIYLADGLSLQYAPTEAELTDLRDRGGRALEGDHQGPGHRQLPAAAQRDVPVLRAPGAVPGVRRHAAAVPGRPGFADGGAGTRRLQPAGPDVRGEDRLGAELGQRVHHRVDLVAADHRPHRPPRSDRPAARRSATPGRG